MCNKCGVAKADLLTLPCRHLIYCANCGEDTNDCMICETRIIATVKVYRC
jgi:hypothetical protein